MLKFCAGLETLLTTLSFIAAAVGCLCFQRERGEGGAASFLPSLVLLEKFYVLCLIPLRDTA